MDKFNAFMVSLLGTSWRTTVFGFIAAVGNLVLSGVSWKSALISVAIQTAGILAKDGAAHSTFADVKKASDLADTAMVKANGGNQP